MVPSAVVSRYANALVDVVMAPSSGVEPSQAVSQLQSFETAVKSSADLRGVLASPAVSATRKRLVIKSIASALGVSSIIRNFILVLSDHRRAGALSQVVEEFEKALDARLGFVRAEVRSAYELTQQQQNELSAQLGKIAGAQVRMRFSVDPDLIGGVAARIGSTVYDGSVRGQLAELRERLAVTH
jgi:F-type H+-transporting ATPase subunit delta